ncbi:short-chain dehydrogenase/reductase family 9C member 7 [Parasteatoda tepidariorum]|uniref:short-chain dehydrogenase/reductase family 9C member 7 n=1 Tax=Parasteatoda tepidariorum TaxID=114398 RepID=UPI00077FB70B|nr:short-chain dehydrogenase/reductase family 9C member 7 [Parasteatoda tepidariorum]
MLQIIYSRGQIPRLTRWNILCIALWVTLSYNILKWTIGLSHVILFLALSSVCYACFVKFNGNVSIRKLRDKSIAKSQAKAVLITGCDTGFGFLTAKRLSERGYQVFACCLFPSKNGGKELSAIPNVHSLGVDVSKKEDVIQALDFVKQHLGKNELWALINNAGISKGSDIEVTSMESIEEVIAVNLLGTIRLTKAFLPLLQKSKGRIINVASAAGRFVMPGFLPYSVSKNAIIWFSDGLRLEVAKFGISVVTIEPWIYKTRLSDPSALSNYVEKQWNNSKEGVNKEQLKYAKKIKRNTGSIFGSLMNPNLDEVINVMEDAVTSSCPPYTYRPGKLYLNLLLWLSSLLPKPIVDYVLCYVIFKCA